MGRMKNRGVKILGWLMGLLLLSACTPLSRPATQVASANVVAALSGPTHQGFARAMAPRPLVFPRDHGAHPEYQTEWWYYTGVLEDEAGHLFGYQLTFFRTALEPDMPARSSDLATNQVYMAHFALTDVAKGWHGSFERYSRGAGGLAGATGEPTYQVWLEDWSVRQTTPDVVHMQAAAERDGESVSLDLTLRETRPPVLHGDAGLSQKGPEPGNASYYYSLIGLETTGSVTRQGRTAQVQGRSWMDHEFGTSALSADAVGWDWFSIQLDDGMALMLAQIRTRDGGRIQDFQGTVIFPDNRQETVAADDFQLTVLDHWTSPNTGVTYPSGWQIELPRFDLTLQISPLLRDQEMQVSFVYWEGAVTVTGKRGGEPVQGIGYVELTGYGSERDGLQR